MPELTLEKLHDHERRLSIVETKIGEMAPRLEVHEMVMPLQTQMQALRATVEQSAQSTERQINKLANELGRGMERLNDINEENMKNAARQVDEKHAAEMALERAKIKRMEEEAEAKKITNRIKEFWLPWFAVSSGAAGAAVLAWQVISWLLANLPK